MHIYFLLVHAVYTVVLTSLERHASILYIAIRTVHVLLKPCKNYLVHMVHISRICHEYTASVLVDKHSCRNTYYNSMISCLL